MQIIPLQSVPAQTVMATLAGQLAQIDLRQRAYGLHLDLRVNGTLLVAGAICQDRNLIVRSAYIGFIGDLCFIDTQGTDDPTYEGLGVRFGLAYIEASEVAQSGMT
ncbi:hypothetical protein DA075_35450 (plasmid) [Methylobacterium currus]|uniref:Cyanophage baseplate Pam3 plug gp18 domain-containing protein n=1 Tax=Methylobacterium currus TaxID=2051553 RepID=A0A2R4WX92_9HYPH|nr:hypothetical protein [Methylobacterium currus]AWB26169.1 hypothetical protein DA075_35450 [Methylobacterium currus]